MARTYDDSSNDVIDFVLYRKNTNEAEPLRFTGTTFIPIPCTINIGDTLLGFDGTLSEFRIFTGTGAIPGMDWISQENCPQAAGIARGTHDPCFHSCYDANCIECTTSTICTTCNQTLYLLNDGVNLPTCPASCPFYYLENDSTGACDKCSSGQVFFNESCLNSCPYGYVETSIKGCAKCDNSLLYYNKTCVSTCPLTTFANLSVYECHLCYFGCESCVNTTKYGCLNCSEGYFYYNNTCNSGCPPDMYADNSTRECRDCQPPCLTCSQPDNLSCTSCPKGYLLLNGTCVTSCPVTHYQGFLGEYPLYQIPACLPKLTLSFNLTLSIEARVIYIDFSYGIVNIIFAIAQRMTIQIANVIVASELYVLSPVTESKIKFQYLGDQHYPPLSVLNVTIDLDADFNTDPYQKFKTVNKSATIQLKEIYPFTTTEIQVITVSSNVTSVGGGAVATGQAVSSLAGGALSLSLVRMQVVGESVQLMRFFDIRWPPNVNEFFATSHIDPSNIVLPIDFMAQWNENLEDRNTSIARVFTAYEVTPFFTENYNNEMSNLTLLLPIVVIGSLMINVLKKQLQNITRKMKTPKTNARKSCKHHYIIFMQTFSRLMNRLNDSVLWNFALIFLLAIFQPGWLWSLVNIQYSKSLVEPATYFTNGSLAIGTLFLTFYTLFAIFVSHVIFSNLRYLHQTKETLRPLHLKKYKTLFDDFDNEKKPQIMYVPFSLIRSIVYATVTALMSSSPFAQILIVWSINLIFIIYMIVYQPLKDKWTRRLTLCIELFAFGCMTFGLVFEIVDNYVEIDPQTLVEVGFAFISLSMASTFAGAVLSLIQVLEIVISIIQYLKKRHRMRNEVRPISLEEYKIGLEIYSHKLKSKPQINSDGESALEKKLAKSPKNLEIDDDSLIKKIGGLSSKNLAKTPEGTQVLESIRTWWKNTGSEEFSDEEVTDVRGRLREGPKKERTILFGNDS